MCIRDSLQHCIAEMAKISDSAFITDGPAGCHVIEKGQTSLVEGFDVNAIDTNGAGDAFAGATLFGLTNGLSATQSAKWGNYFASRVVENIGARIDVDMKDKVSSIVG